MDSLGAPGAAHRLPEGRSPVLEQCNVELATAENERIHVSSMACLARRPRRRRGRRESRGASRDASERCAAGLTRRRAPGCSLLGPSCHLPRLQREPNPTRHYRDHLSPAASHKVCAPQPEFRVVVLFGECVVWRIQVDFSTSNVWVPGVMSAAVSSKMFEALWADVDPRKTSDEWIVQYILAMPQAFYFTTAQVRQRRSRSSNQFPP